MMAIIKLKKRSIRNLNEIHTFSRADSTRWIIKLENVHEKRKNHGNRDDFFQLPRRGDN